MLFSTRHYKALIQRYAETFGAPIPADVLREVACTGRAPTLLEALHKSVMTDNQPITDWAPFAPVSRASSEPI